MPIKMYYKTIIKSIMQKKNRPQRSGSFTIKQLLLYTLNRIHTVRLFFVTSFWRSRKLPTGTYTVPALWIVSTSCCNTITTE